MILQIKSLGRKLLYLYLFLLPWQTLWIWREKFIGGSKWQYGTFVLYGTEILLWLIILLFIFVLISEIKKSKQLNVFSINFRRLPIVSSLVMLLIWSALSIAWSSDRELAFYYWFRLAEAMVLFFIILISKINFNKLAWSLVLAGLFQSILSIWQFITQEVLANKWLGIASHLSAHWGTAVVKYDIYRWLRAYGSFSHPNVLGGFLLLSFLFGLYLYINYSASWQRLVSISLVLLSFVGLFFSFSRSAWLAIAVAYLILFIILFLKGRSHLSPLLKVSVYLFLLAIIIFSIYSPLVTSRLQVSSDLENISIDERLNLIQQADGIINNHWLVGVGIGGFTSELHKIEPGFSVNSYQPVHNIYLLIFAELGIIGLFLFLFLILAIYRILINNWRDNYFPLALLTAVLVIGFFDHYLWTSYVGLIILWLVFSVSCLVENNKSDNKIIRKMLLEAGYYSGYCTVSPSLININITYNCNYRCRGCSSWALPTKNNLTDDEWLILVDQLKKNFSSDVFIDISGGEPIIKKDLTIKVITELKKHFKIVSLNSNGSLINKETAQKLDDIGLDILKLSFYSLDKDTHNFLRGVGHAYDHAISAIEALADTKITLEIGILITKQNIKSIPALISKYSTRPNTYFNLQSLDENYQSDDFRDLENNHLSEFMWPEINESKDFFSWVYANHNLKIRNNIPNIKLMEKYYINPSSSLQLRCFTGLKNLSINPNGDVLLCLKRSAVGNVLTSGIKEILASSESKKERKLIRSCKKYCRIKGLNFSRGIKELFLK